MPHWLRMLKTVGIDRTTGRVIILYLGGVLLALIPIGTIEDPAAYKLAQWVYGIGVIVVTVVLVYWVGRRSTAQLRQSEARYRDLVEQITDGIFVCDGDGRYLEVNPAACALLGYTREEILQRKVRDVIVPEDLAALPVDLERLPINQAISTERRLLHKDGHILVAAINVHKAAANRLLGTVRDVTAQQAVETALQASESQLRALLNAMSDVILVLSADGRYLQVAPTNTAALVAPPDQLCGQDPGRCAALRHGGGRPGCHSTSPADARNNHAGISLDDR